MAFSGAEKAARWRKRHPEKAKEAARAHWERLSPERKKQENRKTTLRRWKLTPEEYEKWAQSQDYRCAVCHKLPEGNLVIDHDHITGAKRALLCKTCNLMLGYSGDSPEILRSAIAYLARFG